MSEPQSNPYVGFYDPAVAGRKTRAPVNEAVNFDWVFFDWGGTLTAGTPAETGTPEPYRTGRAMLEWFKLFGCDVNLTAEQMEHVTAEAHKRTPGRNRQQSIEDNREYSARWMRNIYELVGIDRPVSLGEMETACAYHDWRAREISVAPLNAETVRTLHRFHDAGIRLGVISNNAGYVDDALLWTGVRELFGIVIDSARVGCVKPDYGIFRLAERLTGMSNPRLLYVGDSFSADVVGAMGAGWDAVAWITQSDDEPVMPPGKVHRIRAIPELEAICLP